VNFDEGSFRDPAGRVFLRGEYAYRTLTEQSLAIARDVFASGLVGELHDAGLIAYPELVRTSDAGVDLESDLAWIVRQPRVPFVSYAYEWSFEMLRRAALVTLEILQRSLTRGFILKDAPSFNILFFGTRAVHVDFGSFARRGAGAPWVGYSQFCRSFLYPLLLEAHAGLPFRPLLRGYLGEIPVNVAASSLGFRSAARSGVLLHVLVQHHLQRRFADAASEVAAAASSLKQTPETLAAMFRRLVRVVERLRPRHESDWSEYSETCSYSDEGRAAKRSIVERAVADARPGRLLDLGSNTGEYVDVVRPFVGHVVGIDADAPATDVHYRRLQNDSGVSLAVADVARPTPALGWNLRERQALLPRLQSDFLVALALVHHLRITSGIPLAFVVPALVSLAPAGIIEWVGPEDPMVRRMLALREDVFTDYRWEVFIGLLHEQASRVEVNHVQPERTLCRYWRR
jgi:hypothetical protein